MIIITMENITYRPNLPITRIMLFLASLLVFAAGISLYLFTLLIAPIGIHELLQSRSH